MTDGQRLSRGVILIAIAIVLAPAHFVVSYFGPLFWVDVAISALQSALLLCGAIFLMLVARNRGRLGLWMTVSAVAVWIFTITVNVTLLVPAFVTCVAAIVMTMRDPQARARNRAAIAVSTGLLTLLLVSAAVLFVVFARQVENR